MSFNSGKNSNSQNFTFKPPAPSRENKPAGRVFVALDTETTGTEPDQGEIIEIAAIRFRLSEGGQTHVLERWQTFVRPRNPIPYKISHLTGIQQTDVERAPTFNEVRERLRTFLGNSPIVGHSIESDFAFLARQDFLVNNVPLDTYELATLIMPQMGNYSLVAVATTLKVVPDGAAHRAMADTLMAMEVFATLVGKIEELPLDILREVNRVAAEINDWPICSLFTDAAAVIERQNQSGGAFGSLGALLKQQLAEKQGNDLDFMFLLPQEKTEPLQPRPDFTIPLTLLNDRAAHVSGLVAEAFQNHQHLLLEMPGNEGERITALVAPAAEIGVREGRTVVIATTSESQRERLLNKVIPELQKSLTALLEPEASQPQRKEKRRRGDEKPPFIATSVKHQNSYLCLRRWEIFRKMDGLTSDELKLLIKVLLWLPNTVAGDGAELRITNQERLWSRINTQKNLCLASHCQFNQRGQCFYFAARDRAENAHLVVVDQSLILADAVGQAGTLPQFEHLVIDDAHHFEDEASRQFGTAINPNTLFDFLDWLNRPVTWKPDGGQSGFLHYFDRHYGPDTTSAVKEILAKLRETVASQVEICRQSTGNLLRDLADLLTRINQVTGQGDGRVRLDMKFRNGEEWREIVGAWEVFKQDWEELYYELRDLRDESHALKLQMVKTDEMMLDLNYFVNQSNYLINKLAAAFEEVDSNHVYWLASHPRTQLVGVYSAPLSVDQGLEHTLFSSKKSVVLASSTLTTDGDFTFIRNRLGLHDARTAKILPERDFAATTMLYLPTDMPEPSQTGYQKAVDQQIIELAKISQGRMLALFSSNSALRMSYKAVQRTLEQNNILVLGLGLDGTRRSVLSRFRSTEKALLLSTLGHWENAELFAEDENNVPLSFNVLAITKLPFDPPSDPVFAARTESRQFADPFLQYSLPRTILRFKQAYERLLEVMRERGAVLILDSRLTHRAYGPTFINSLPALYTRHDSLSRLVPEVRNWLEKK